MVRLASGRSERMAMRLTVLSGCRLVSSCGRIVSTTPFRMVRAVGGVDILGETRVRSVAKTAA
jgi:hypothetical protein